MFAAVSQSCGGVIRTCKTTKTEHGGAHRGGALCGEELRVAAEGEGDGREELHHVLAPVLFVLRVYVKRGDGE